LTDPQFECDVLIIGSGAAGLSLAVRLAQSFKVAVIAKKELEEGCTQYAQGGIAAVLNNTDSIESHVEDTLRAGAGLCDAQVVRHTVEHSRKQIQWLINLQVPFTQVTGTDGVKHFHLTREGGHSQRRVIHAADATGQAIETSLIAEVKNHSNIETFERHIAIDLITERKLGRQDGRCVGAYVFNRDAGHVRVFKARFVVLATGGASKVYLYTSNPDVTTGDGIAMAWRAGCRVANMEFIQFHPTCLYHPHAKSFLITEAIRGEGGKLLLPDGSPFMHQFDPRAELAPRDIVARAIDHEMKRLGIPCVYLDISHKDDAFIKTHFPTIYAKCLEFGIDMTKDPIPVVPAAHYTCGGVMTGLNGQTDIAGLYAIGETAFTGLHGANRMASNSLLECLIYADSAAHDISRQMERVALPAALPEWDESRVTDSDEEVVVAHNWDELRRFMWDYVGIVRTNKRLERAKRRVDLLLHEIDEYYGNFRVTNDLIELRNLTLVANLIIRSAMSRKESRGLHYTLNYPQPDDTCTPENTILIPRNYTPLN
jgi:L-aspartate oxidase